MRQRPLKLTSHLAFSWILAASLSTGSADILAKWDLSGEDGTQVEVPPVEDSVIPGLQVSPITRGAGLFVTGSSAFAAGGFASTSTPQTQTLADAIQNETFFEVTLTPEAGKALDLSSVTFASKIASKKSGPNSLVVRTSLDDFTDDVVEVTETHPSNGPDASDVELWLFDNFLHGIQEPITLRFYGFGRNQLTHGGGIWVIGNNSNTEGFTINGTLSSE